MIDWGLVLDDAARKYPPPEKGWKQFELWLAK